MLLFSLKAHITSATAETYYLSKEKKNISKRETKQTALLLQYIKPEM